MANVVVTKNNDFIEVDFGVYGGVVFPGLEAVFYRRAITNVTRHAACVEIKLSTGVWWVSYNGEPDTLQVDSVEGSAPTSNQDLYNKLVALMV